MRQASAMLRLAVLVVAAWVLVPAIGLVTREPGAQEEAPRFSRVARKVLTPKCALHY